MVSRLNSLRRALADYSLRKFILFAVNPAHWRQLLEERRRARAQVEEFSRQVSNWQEILASACSEPNPFFRPWLRGDSGNDLQSSQGSEPFALTESSDPEVILGRDRLGWMLQSALIDDVSPWQDFDKWFAERWTSGISCRDAYTLSERLANLTMMWALETPPAANSDEVLRMMENDAERLLASIEYHGDSKTNNHVLNNARGLILFGAFAGNARFFAAGSTLLHIELSKHVLADGVLREGSSHYQWVVTRWVVEIACAFHAVDRQRFQLLLPLLERMLNACEEMKLGPPGRKYLPLVGDISPDFPPGFYAGLTDFGYAVIGAGDEVSSSIEVRAGFWGHYFVGRSKHDVHDTWYSSDGSWGRVTTGQWSILTHADRQSHDNRTTHGHHDLFSFELAFAGTPLIVDPGRKSYSAPRDSEDAGILEEWHNTIMVNRARTGFVPRGYMPADWLKQWRSRPELEVSETGLGIRLDAPHEIPGVSRIQRTIQCLAPDRVRIVNQVFKNTAGGIDVLLVLYLMGEVRLTGHRADVTLGGRCFRLNWAGLGTPLIRLVSRYVSYGSAEPCTRLEWNIEAETGTWESVITVELSGSNE